jgi:Domain of unknown function (DUF4123)
MPYLLFDSARAETNLYNAMEVNPNCQSLYKGSAEEELEGVAPYLFSYEQQSKFANWYQENGWGDSWGILVYSEFPFELVYKHFRKFLMVKTEDGEQLYFRFYDPRVLRIFLPTCDTEQLKEIFGLVEHFICEDEDPAFGLVFTFENNQLQTKRIPKEEIFPSEGTVVKKSARKFFA